MSTAEGTSSKWQTCIIEYNGFSYAELIAIMTINTTIGVSNIVLNGFLVYASMHLKLVTSVSYKFMMFLSMSDVCIGVLQLGIQMVPFANRSMRDVLNLVMQFFNYLFCAFSAFMIMLISLDRFFHMAYLTKYNTVMNKTRSNQLILFNVLLTFANATFMTIASITGSYFIYHPIFTTLYLFVISLTSILYIASYKAIRNRTAVLNLNQTAHEAAKGRRSRDVERAFAKATMFVLISLVICYVPNHSLLLARSIMHHNDQLAEGMFLYVLLWAIIGSYANGTLNALALIIFSKRLRRFTMRCLKFRFLVVAVGTESDS